ncbi:GtrA family protein [Ramlibacter terrae]|uniref:GtrA family protein n=1 Tax=Ramlibacter terrae TaxID=2732511 RepID=A0ABX6P6E4_9BURK|nr:GtrA family protein [Ramlibacter terrae]
MTASKFVELPIAVPAVAPAGRPGRIGREFVRYFGCSAVALGADGGLFGLGLYLGVPYPVAAAIGFIAGLWVAYTLSVRFVFGERRLQDQRAEFFIFASVGVGGLLLTELFLWLLVDHAHWHPGFAKVATAGAVFCFNFGARKALLFTKSSAP